MRNEGLKYKRILDFGAKKNISQNLSCLRIICRTNGSVAMGDGSIIRIKKVGTKISMAVVDAIQKIVSISHVSCVPKLTTNLLAVCFFKRKKLYVTVKDGENESGMVAFTEKETGLVMISDRRTFWPERDIAEAKRGI